MNMVKLLALTVALAIFPLIACGCILKQKYPDHKYAKRSGFKLKRSAKPSEDGKESPRV